MTEGMGQKAEGVGVVDERQSSLPAPCAARRVTCLGREARPQPVDSLVCSLYPIPCDLPAGRSAAR